MYSGRDFAWLYERCNQVAFLDGHVRAVEHFGGVAQRCIYDGAASGAGLLSRLVQELAHLGEAGAGDLQVRVQGQGALDALQRLLLWAAQVEQGDLPIPPQASANRGSIATAARYDCSAIRWRPCLLSASPRLWCALVLRGSSSRVAEERDFVAVDPRLAPGLRRRLRRPTRTHARRVWGLRALQVAGFI